MKKTIRRALSILFLVLVAPLMAGAGGQVNSGLTGSASSAVSAGGIASTPSSTSPAVSRVTGSVTSGLVGGPTSSVTGSTPSNATSVISKGTNSPITLSPYAEEVARAIKFDRQVLLLVKEETQEHIYRLIGYDEDNYQIMAPGISVSVPEDKSDGILLALRRKLAPLHYLPFVVEMNEGLRTEKIGVIKGTDQYEILRIMHTGGGEYDISNQDVIDRLKEWENLSSFDIIGADSDWVELEFKSLPKDLKAFAEEVYEFSPDTVDQGPGNVEGLIKEIMKTNRLFLWWD